MSGATTACPRVLVAMSWTALPNGPWTERAVRLSMFAVIDQVPSDGSDAFCGPSKPEPRTAGAPTGT